MQLKLFNIKPIEVKKIVYKIVGSFFPSNGSEGMDFEENYCSSCTKNKSCDLVLLAMSEKDSIDQWVLIQSETDTVYFCLDFKTRDKNHRLHQDKIEITKGEK